MNILHLSANYPPMIGGPASSVPYIVEEQLKLGHKVYVLTSGIRDKNDATYIFRCNISTSNNNMLGNLLKLLKMGIIGRRIIKKYRIDIIHVHDPNISALAHFIADPFNKIPSIVKYSGDLSIELIGKIFLPLIILERLIFKTFTKVQVQSKWNKCFLQRYCKVPESKIIFIPNGINLNNFAPQNKNNLVPIIVSSCRLEKWKGLEYSIKAMKHLNATYIIFGDGKEKNNLLKLIRDEKLTDRVFLVGKIPHSELHTHLSKCDLMIVPSLYEPFGITILDGFNTNIPVIGSNIGGIPELLEPDQLFKAGDISDIVIKAIDALKNKDKIIKSQNNKLTNYSWNKIVADLEKQYTELLNTKK